MYENGFYVKSNIIGYTGNINLNPTVYFRNGNKFGHITQYHTKSTNIGREKVRMATDYKITNRKDGHAEEFWSGRVNHVSRNLFTTASWFEKFKLSKAIDQFRNLKVMYGGPG